MEGVLLLTEILKSFSQSITSVCETPLTVWLALDHVSEAKAFQAVILVSNEASCVILGKLNGMKGTTNKKKSRNHSRYWILPDKWLLSILLIISMTQIKREIGILQ